MNIKKRTLSLLICILYLLLTQGNALAKKEKSISQESKQVGKDIAQEGKKTGKSIGKESKKIGHSISNISKQMWRKTKEATK